MIAVSCPACLAVGAKTIAVRHDLRLVRCNACSLVFLSPQPIDRVREKYENEYDLAAHFAPFAPRKKVLFERRLAWMPKPTSGADKICDVGCADGQFLELAASAGWRPHGIEMNPPAAARARERGATIYQGVFEELTDVPWGTFDVVTSWDSLEHTPRPRDFAANLIRLLKPGGRLVLTTLNVRSLAWWVFRMHWSMVVEDHFTYWNEQSIRTMFDSLGLPTLAFQTYSLGRDFVSSLDAAIKLVRPARPSAATATATPASPRWDVNKRVLLAEDTLNLVFERLGGGAALQAQFVKPG